jgi:hypothetical protein
LLPRILIVIEKKKRNSFLFIFQSFIEIKPQNNNRFSFLGHIKMEEKSEREKKKQTLMADDDDYFDINSINDLSSSSFPPVTLSTIEKIQEQQDKQNNQVDFLFHTLN